MAAAPQSAPSPPAAPQRAARAAAGPRKGPASRPDISTLAGIAVAVAGIVGGLVLEKGSIQDIAQATAAMIVFGGTLGAVLVTNPLPVVVRAVGALRGVFFEQSNPASDTIDSLIRLATKARKNGIVSLEAEAAAIADPFLRKALNLAPEPGVV